MSSYLNSEDIEKEISSHFEEFLNTININNKKIAERLNSERKKLNLSKTRLAKLLYCSRQTITSWEKINSNTIPPLNEMIKLCKIYDCDLEYLLCLTDFKHSSAKLLSPLYGLTDETLTFLNENFDFITSVVIDDEIGAPDFQDISSLEKVFFFSFINHLICGLLNYPEVMKYIYFEKLNYDLSNEKYEKQIRKAFNTFHISPISNYPFYDVNAIEDIHKQLRNELCKSNVPCEEHTSILNNATRYIPLLCTETRAIEKMKFNMAIDDIIFSYIENKKGIEDNYLNFISNCIKELNKNISK